MTGGEDGGTGEGRGETQVRQQPATSAAIDAADCPVLGTFQ